MKDLEIYHQLEQTAQQTKVINTHEHIIPSSLARQEVDGLASLFALSYVKLDLISSGMPPELLDRPNLQWTNQPAASRPTLSEDQVWDALVDYLPRIAHTSYCRCLVMALAKLFQTPEFPWDKDTWVDISQKLAQANSQTDWYEEVLVNNANYEISLLDQFWSPGESEFDQRFFRPSMRVDAFINGQDPHKPDRNDNILAVMAPRWGGSVDTFDDLLQLFDTAFERTIQQGGPCVKLAMAYERDLSFATISRQRAKSLYGKPDVSPGEFREFQDFMVGETIARCRKYNLPLQIHTGMLARNFHTLEHTKPTALNNLFLANPEVTFILFHASYPYYREGAIMAKMLPNVFFDLCWLPMISPSAATIAFREILDLVPANKLLWGGDGHCVEESLGALLMMRQVVAKSLTPKVVDKEMDLGTAQNLIQRILRDNALEIFRL